MSITCLTSPKRFVSRRQKAELRQLEALDCSTCETFLENRLRFHSNPMRTSLCRLSPHYFTREKLSQKNVLVRNTQEIDIGIYSKACTTFEISIQLNYIQIFPHRNDGNFQLRLRIGSAILNNES